MTTKSFIVSLLTAAALLVSVGQANAASYMFTDLGTSGGTNSYARAINNAGQIAGYSYSNPSGPTIPILWNGTTATQLDTNGGITGLAAGINNAGQVVGHIDGYATVWNGTTITELGRMSGNQGGAKAINDAGQVAGSTFVNGGSTVHATVWNGTTATDLDPFNQRREDSYAHGINGIGQVVGESQKNALGKFHATLWNGTVSTDLGTLGRDQSSATDINNAGQVVGFSWGGVGVTSDYRQALLWNGNTATKLDTLGGIASSAYAINNLGQIVGSSDGRAVIWNGTTAIDLNNVLEVGALSSGWELIQARDINDNGQIVGLARNVSLMESHAFLLTPVPEPETYAMLLAGLGLTAFMSRRRKQS